MSHRHLTERQRRAILAKARSDRMKAYNERKRAGNEIVKAGERAGEFIADKVTGGGYTAGKAVIHGSKSVKKAIDSVRHDQQAKKGFRKLRKNRER